MSLNTFDLTTREGVQELMRSSANEDEWNANAYKVKVANARNGRPEYPEFWFSAIIVSGILSFCKDQLTWK